MSDVKKEELGKAHTHWSNSGVTFKVDRHYNSDAPQESWYSVEVAHSSYGDLHCTTHYSVKEEDLKAIARMFNLVVEKISII